tara:strand:- start:1102 stop:1350 length:249 start_codon:yes stop_codon:yes gene_type:complete
MKNPIKNNRVVGGIHFAIRLLSFAQDMESGCACGEDEKESMISYGCKLLEYQIQTATDKYEIEYLKINNASKKLKQAKKYLR